MCAPLPCARHGAERGVVVAAEPELRQRPHGEVQLPARLQRGVAAQVAFEKAKAWNRKPGFHFIRSRVETRVVASYEKWIGFGLCSPHRLGHARRVVEVVERIAPQVRPARRRRVQ